MKVSVIIPAYNAAKTIEETLKSVFAQTYKEIEIIVINDGSIDDTSNKLLGYDGKIKLITTENRGVSSARNTGLQNATGDFIQYLDSDDLLIADKIERQLTILLKECADIAYGNWYKCYDKDGVIYKTEGIERIIDGNPEITVFENFWCPPAALLYSRAIVEKIGGWKEWLPVVEDARYLLDAVRANGKLVYTPFYVAKYRQHSQGSLSTNNQERFINCIFLNAVDISKNWKAENKESPEHIVALINVFRHCVNVFGKLGNSKTKEAIAMILEIQPNYIPEEKGMLRFISQKLGYLIAERIANLKRRTLG
jgi:glycosyltransferase involved in cell wall biosynthesis